MKTSRLVALAVVLWVAVLAGAIVRYGGQHGDTAHAAIVLGAAVWGDEPSPVYQAHLDQAVDLYHVGRVSEGWSD